MKSPENLWSVIKNLSEEIKMTDLLGKSSEPEL